LGFGCSGVKKLNFTCAGVHVEEAAAADAPRVLLQKAARAPPQNPLFTARLRRRNSVRINQAPSHAFNKATPHSGICPPQRAKPQNVKPLFHGVPLHNALQSMQ